MLPVLKNLLYVTLIAWVWEKDINGVVYFWQWLLYTRVIGVVESPTTVYMRDDWEKLSDEKSSLRACRRRIPNRSRVVSCESRIVHMFYYLCLYSLHLLHRTLYRRTHSLPFFCASNVYTTSVVPAYIARLCKRQFGIFGQLEYNLQYNICIYNTIQYKWRTYRIFKFTSPTDKIFIQRFRFRLDAARNLQNCRKTFISNDLGHGKFKLCGNKKFHRYPPCPSVFQDTHRELPV